MTTLRPMAIAFLLVQFVLATASTSAALVPGIRWSELAVETNSQCLTCPPNVILKTDSQQSEGIASFQTSSEVGAAKSNQESLLNTVGANQYAYSIEATIAVDSPMTSTEFGYHNANAELKFDFVLDAPVQYSLIGNIAIDSAAPPELGFNVGNVRVVASDGSTVFEHAGHQNINESGQLGPGDYQFVLDARSAGSVIEYGSVAVDAALSFLAMDMTGDYDGDGVLSAGDVDLLTNVLAQGAKVPVTDLNNDGQFDSGDRSSWVKDVVGTFFGDSNLDGEFDTADLILVFQQSQFEDDIVGNSTWATGDWNGDSEFDSTDLIAAFADGGYEQGPGIPEVAVPEPTALAPLFLLLAYGLRLRKPLVP